MNYLALTVVAELDDFMYQAHNKLELAKKIVDESQGDGDYRGCFIVETTTSTDGQKLDDSCKSHKDENDQIDETVNKFEKAVDFKWVERRHETEIKELK